MNVCRCDYVVTDPASGRSIVFWQVVKKGSQLSTITGFDDKTHGWSKAVVQRMGGVEIADAFLRGEYELRPVAKATTSAERITFMVTGTGLTAEEWTKRLESKGYKLLGYAKEILSKPDYDRNHRLEAGKEYKIVLVRGKEIRKDSDRSTANLKAMASCEFGGQSVTGLKGELALLVSEKFTHAELEAMGLGYIIVLHEPIIGSDGHPRVLRSRRRVVGSWVRADRVSSDSSDSRWHVRGAFAFFAS